MRMTVIQMLVLAALSAAQAPALQSPKPPAQQSAKAPAQQDPKAPTQLGAKAPAQEKAKSPLIVHEWGTFTSMQGSDGIGLEGLHHEEEALPKFVHDLGKVVAIGQRAVRQRRTKFAATRVTQKMETPVIYFYTDKPLHVQVRVGFKNGLMTQFYPIPDLISPPLSFLTALRKASGGAVDMRKIKFSHLIWEVDLLPFGSVAPREIPRVHKGDPWAEARQVRAAYVRVRENKAIKRRAEAEHYLFYRGLGRFDLPYKVVASPGGTAVFDNRDKHAIPFAVAVEMTATSGRFVVLGAVESGQREFTLASVPLRTDRKRVAGELGAVIHTALVDSGLYVDEARAMVATWSRQWFRTPGTRVIYVLPRPLVDGMLPLSVKPVPAKTVRVLVGRLEYLTPEVEARVDTALLERCSADASTRSQGEAYLAQLDRFLEPHVRRVAVTTTNDAVRKCARDVLESLAR